MMGWDMIGANILQVRDTYGCPTHSELVSAEELYNIIHTQKKHKSILTPSGYHHIDSIEIGAEQPLVELTFSIGADRPKTIITDSTQLFCDFNNQEVRAVTELNKYSAILSYTNTETKCYGFVLSQAVAQIISVKLLDSKEITYTIKAGNNKFYIERLKAV